MALAYENLVPSSYRAGFLAKVQAISNRLQIDPNWLMIVIRFESAGTFSPSVKNPYSEAYGLIQFTKVGVSGLGVTLDQIKVMDAITQLDYVEKYLKPYTGRMTDLYSVYLAVFAPVYIGRPDAQKVYVSPSKEYTSNKALDTNNDGVITVGEIKAVISRYIPAGYSAGSLTTDEKVFPIAAIAVVLFLFFALKRV
ncbi:hypothetical protein GCM10028806_19610 [Spirosoma terrae]|uniref:Transglycosylase SLT domain-containing protein n=1 Tax=Spirosoma terrae TaxID=1968276 RepID=A0A6L9L5R3_9BACT|nr:transglycosylase SLT domain-containing protein [Spirosoma terrae]NDU94722.1 transglycosylase SLT domain-containing protein [Spirosoma terrae]